MWSQSQKKRKDERCKSQKLEKKDRLYRRVKFQSLQFRLICFSILIQSVDLFDVFVRALHWILVVIDDFRIVLHYLDEFIIIMKFLIDFESFQIIWRYICKVLDFESNEKKKKFDTKFDFLDIELDSEIIEAQLSSIKLARAMKTISVNLIADFLSYRQIDFLVCFLSFCAKIVISRRSFLIFLYLTWNRTWNVNKACRINDAIRVDLQWWHEFLSRWNDIRVLRKVFSRLSSHIWIDVSDSWSVNDFWLRALNDESRESFSWRYSTRYRRRHHDIQVNKIRTVLEALRQWLSHFVNSKVIIHYDNQAVYSRLVKGTIHGQPMASLREVVMLFALHDILAEVKWLDSKSISRRKHGKITDKYLQLQVFQMLQTNGTPRSRWGKTATRFLCWGLAQSTCKANRVSSTETVCSMCFMNVSRSR